MIEDYRSKLCKLILICASILILLISVASAEVSFSIRNNQYVFPPSEFAGTKEYPDILMIKNEYIDAEVLPNRGITLWKLKSELTGMDYLYFNPSPLPYLDELTMTYYADFGGYYPLYPWNNRDNQPYMVKYEILEKSSEKVRIYMHGEDIEKGVMIEEWLSFEEKSTKISINMKITNLSGKKLSFTFGDRLVLLIPSESTYIEIPASNARIVMSEDNWMGEEGEIVTWPQEWAMWKNFKAPGVASLDIKKPYIAIVNKEADEIFVKVWKPAEKLEEVVIRSWGPKYEDAHFEAPVMYIETRSPKIVLDSKESFEVESYLFVIKGLTSLSSVSEFGAGLIELQKGNYTIGEESALNLKLVTTSLVENVRVKLLLLDHDKNLVKELTEESLGEASPNKVVSKIISFKISDVDPGSYILQVKVLSDKEEILTMQEEVMLLAGAFMPSMMIVSIIVAVIIVIVIAILIVYRRSKKK